MIERYLLRYFLAVIDEGNFSRAAVRCGVSQPTLSIGIAKLEQHVGRPLFNRTSRRVEVTQAGGVYAGLHASWVAQQGNWTVTGGVLHMSGGATNNVTEFHFEKIAVNCGESASSL